MTMTAGSTAPLSLWCPPRFGTPRSNRPTLGGEVADVAVRLGKPLMPWQQHVADVAFEVTADGNLWYRFIVLTVPRQSGKTTLVMAKTLWRLTKLAHRLGPQRSTYTAQRRQNARKKLELDFAPAMRASKFFPEVEHNRIVPKRPTEWRLNLNNGSERIQVGPTCYWQIDAPTEEGGHGDTLDDGTIDEAFVHQDDEVEGAMSPSQITRPSAQTWVLSTAGNEKSYYLWRKVLEGRSACETGNHGRTAYFEWSAPDDADPGDPETWRLCSPALGHTITLDALAAEWEKAQRAQARGQEGISTFRRAYLNQWPDIPVLPEEAAEVESKIPAGDWLECLDRDPANAPTKVEFALDVSPDRKRATIGASGRRSDGRFHVEVVENRHGTSWLVARTVELVGRHGGHVTLDPAGPAGALIEPLVEAGVEVRKVTMREHAQACGAFVDDVIEHQLRHGGQDVLDNAVAAAVERNVEDVWLWSRRRSGDADITPVVAVTLARWAASKSNEGPPNLW